MKELYHIISEQTYSQVRKIFMDLLNNNSLHTSKFDSLSIKFSECSAESFKWFFCFLTTYQSFTSLTLASEYDNDIDIDMKRLFLSLMNNTNLSKLCIENTKIDKTEICYLTSYLKNNTNISTLSLIAVEIDADHIAGVFHSLHLNRSLTTLNLSFNPISNKGLHEISNYLKCTSMLTNLDIDSIFAVGDMPLLSVLEDFSDALKGNNSIKTFNFTSNNLDSIRVRTLASALTMNTTLQRLDLSYNAVTDEGMKYLCQMLKYNSSLETLICEHNYITKEGFKYFLSALRTNTSIQSLDIYRNKIEFWLVQSFTERANDIRQSINSANEVMNICI